MVVSKEHLEQVGLTFSRLYEDRDLDVIERLYREDAVFISPNPPDIVPGFGTRLEGRDEILRFFEATMDRIPAGHVTTVALLNGVDMAVWVWQAGTRKGADIMLLDEDGLIMQQRVTAPRPD